MAFFPASSSSRTTLALSRQLPLARSQFHPSSISFSTIHAPQKRIVSQSFYISLPANLFLPSCRSSSCVPCAHGDSASTPFGEDEEEDKESSQQQESQDFNVGRSQGGKRKSPDPTAFKISVESSEQSFDPSFATPSNKVVTDSEKDLQTQEQIRETLAVLTQSLAVLSVTINELSSAVERLSSALSGQTSVPSSTSYLPTPTPESASTSFPLTSAHNDPEAIEKRDLASMSSVSDPPEPWDNSRLGNGGRRTGDGERDRVTSQSTAGSNESHVPYHLVEQNLRAHRLAYKLQQSFVQARIQGLGKPFQVAAEEFVDACMEAHALGMGLKELQLQLILQDGSLTGAFAIRNQRWSDDPIMNEESRIRSLWVRLIYATIAEMNPIKGQELEVDPIDAFVKRVIQQALEKGYELERVKLEQTFAGQTISSGAAKVMRENQYLILLTLEKTKLGNK